MCRPHWNQYTSALRKAALARKASDGDGDVEVAPTESEPVAVAAPKAVGGRKTKESRTPRPGPVRTRVARGRQQATPEAGSQGDAG